jgi:hypothetical protein
LRAGMTDVVIDISNNLAVAADHLLRRHTHEGVLSHFGTALENIPSPWVTRFCAYCLENPTQATTVQEVTTHIGGTRQHIAHDFRKNGLCQPGTFITAARLVHVAHWTEKLKPSRILPLYYGGQARTLFVKRRAGILGCRWPRCIRVEHTIPPSNTSNSC